jgi:hypothetical protein
MNSAPVPGPSLWAAMLPPCNSTRDFTRARPSPSPRAILPAAGALPERVEHPHPQDDLPGFRPRGQPDVSATVLMIALLLWLTVFEPLMFALPVDRAAVGVSGR